MTDREIERIQNKFSLCRLITFYW